MDLNIGDLKCEDEDGAARIAESDVDNAAAMENFFSVFTVKDEDEMLKLRAVG